MLVCRSFSRRNLAYRVSAAYAAMNVGTEKRPVCATQKLQEMGVSTFGVYRLTKLRGHAFEKSTIVYLDTERQVALPEQHHKSCEKAIPIGVACWEAGEDDETVDVLFMPDERLALLLNRTVDCFMSDERMSSLLKELED